MADNETTTKVEEKEASSTAGKPEGTAADLTSSASGEAAEDLMSLDDLDSVIAQTDPEFLNSLGSIGPEIDQEIYAEGADLQFSLQDELKLWENDGKLKKLTLKIFPFIPSLSYKLKMKRTALRISFREYRVAFVHGIKNLPKAILGFLKARIASLKHLLSDGMTAFKAYSLKQKMAFVGLVVASILAIVFLQKMFTKGIVPDEKNLFLGSLSEWSQQAYNYDANTQLESFYESTRMTQNILLLRKMIVNIRPSSESGSNPMGAFEFFVEGTVSEVVVEVKDREAEITDLFRRTISEMTFDQISSGEGKQLLCERLRNEMNTVLTKGLVRRVFIKNAIVKP